ncbi:hypothetical protein I4F81_006497 [Pyropia yezoensis]|uniref:Uncharacterized protein n=1 Tax=Pyropia yezoensis TaxID=2788 RepID=A0ACC3C1V5_PYRYE|nr:hypothetical protein I4F81_006497 [Neopyropia yezoensis]
MLAAFTTVRNCIGRPEDAQAGAAAPQGQGSDLLTGRGSGLRGRSPGWFEVQQRQHDAADDIIPLGDAQLRGAFNMMLEHVHTCTAAGSLGIDVTRATGKRGVVGGISSGVMEAAKPGSVAWRCNVAALRDFAVREELVS